MAYRFVQAHHDYGMRIGPVRAFVVHMAEGGGTVGYLSREQSRGVSVHYVIEYSGRIVQMLREDHASGSINPNDLRTTDDPAPSPFGATVRRRVMGDWDRDPNSAVISLEIEGFAAAGPNVDQLQALGRLVDDVRSRFPTMGLLGHRDFADYKACPGRRIPWTILGGHGPASSEVDDMLGPFPIGVDPKILTLRPGAELLELDGRPGITFNRGTPQSPFNYRTGGITYRVVIVPTDGVNHLWLVKPTDVVSADPLPSTGDCAAAIAADRATARIVWG